jgi:hypothetical protein
VLSNVDVVVFVFVDFDVLGLLVMFMVFDIDFDSPFVFFLVVISSSLLVVSSLSFNVFADILFLDCDDVGGMCGEEFFDIASTTETVERLIVINASILNNNTILACFDLTLLDKQMFIMFV